MHFEEISCTFQFFVEKFTLKVAHNCGLEASVVWDTKTKEPRDDVRCSAIHDEVDSLDGVFPLCQCTEIFWNWGPTFPLLQNDCQQATEKVHRVAMKLEWI